MLRVPSYLQGSTSPPRSPSRRSTREVSPASRAQRGEFARPKAECDLLGKTRPTATGRSHGLRALKKLAGRDVPRAGRLARPGGTLPAPPGEHPRAPLFLRSTPRNGASSVSALSSFRRHLVRGGWGIELSRLFT